MGIKDHIRDWIPSFVLDWYRQRKKASVRKGLEDQRNRGEVISQDHLVSQLEGMGIVKGDLLLVHSSMSKVGYLDEGPETLIHALREVLGPEGTLVMPSSPVDRLQLDHIRLERVFDVRNTPSRMGAITERFRRMPGVVRSIHPTEPVCALGPLAEYITGGHMGRITPYDDHSPWYRVAEKKGKILYVGVTLINSGTSLHVLEDAVDFKFPVYLEEVFTATVIDHEGRSQEVRTRVHNPEMSKRRRCDELIPWFEKEGVLKKTRLGQADCLLLNAGPMLEVMIRGYREKGITMYTPRGEELNLG